MNKSYKLYLVFVLIGIGLAGWAASKWKNQVDKRFDVLDEKKRAPSRKLTPSVFDGDYDRSGKTAALRAYLYGPERQKQPNPVFWAKGSLTVVVKDNWTTTELAYRRCNVSRDDLHQMLDDTKRMPNREVSLGDIQLMWTNAEGVVQVRNMTLDKFKDLSKSWLGSRKTRPYTLQAVELRAEAIAKDEKTVRWPIGRISLTKLLESGPSKFRSSDVVRRIQEVIKQPTAFTAGKVRARISAQALVDR